MIAEPSATATEQSSESHASVLITVSTPGANTPICRLGNSEEIIGDLTVRQLIDRVISPNSLFSVGVPMSQLEAESPTALAIGELLSANSCQVLVAAGGDAGRQPVPLDQPARAVARVQVGTQGNKFLNISLDVRAASDGAAPTGHERRQVPVPEAVEVKSEPSTPDAQDVVQKPTMPAPTEQEEASPPPQPSAEPISELTGGPVSQPSAEPASEPAAEPIPEPSAEPDREPAPELAAQSVPADGILTIVAESPKEEPKQPIPERTEYVRKSDWLRAQFLPEVEALDFSGLFVGNLGLGVREDKGRRNVVLADPSRITDVLLRANGYRRSGDHAKALICYQELVDMDPSNADFRFLLGKTLLALGQRDEAADAFTRAKELGHDGAEKELDELTRSGHRQRSPLGFLRFWKQ